MFYSENLKKFNQIQHCFFSRKNGNSLGIYKSLNCGIGSKDDKDKIKKNLDLVANNFKIKIKQLVLMNQTHSNKVKVIENFNDNIKLIAPEPQKSSLKAYKYKLFIKSFAYCQIHIILIKNI